MSPVKKIKAQRIRKGLTSPLSLVDDYGDRLLRQVEGGGFIQKATGDSGPPQSRQIQDPFEDMYTYGGALIPPLDPYRLLQLVENQAIHGACITAKAADTVGRGWLWEPSDDTADPNQVKDINQLLEDVTPEMSFSELLLMAVWEKNAVGWSGWECAREGDLDIYTGKEKVGGLFPMPAHTIRATKDKKLWVQIKNIEIRYFKVFGCPDPYDARTGKTVGKQTLKDYLAGKDVDFEPAREIIVFKTYSPRSPHYGIPTWIGAMPAMAELQAIREFNISFFQSGGTADRIIHATATDDAVAQVLATKIEETIRDAAGRGHTTIVTHGNPQTSINVTPMNGPQGQVGGRDGQFKQRREDLVKEVLMAHNVPPYRIGWSELGSLGGSAAKEMLRAYKVGSIEQEQMVLKDRLDHTLFGPTGLNIKDFDWKLETLDWDETELNLSIAQGAVDAGIITRNEARDLLGKERYEDPAMDRTTVTGRALLPVSTSGEAASLTAVIGELRTALEAAIRGPLDPTLVPEGPSSPGVESAPGGMSGGTGTDLGTPGAKPPAAPTAAPGPAKTPPPVTHLPGQPPASAQPPRRRVAPKASPKPA